MNIPFLGLKPNKRKVMGDTEMRDRLTAILEEHKQQCVEGETCLIELEELLRKRRTVLTEEDREHMREVINNNGVHRDKKA